MYIRTVEANYEQSWHFNENADMAKFVINFADEFDSWFVATAGCCFGSKTTTEGEKNNQSLFASRKQNRLQRF